MFKPHSDRKILSLLLAVSLAVSPVTLTYAKTAPAQTDAVISYGTNQDIFHPIHAQHGMVASADAYATEVGVNILKQGGNAIDAAVAVGFTLAVTYPKAGNLGGGGFMLIKTKEGKVTAIDFRETAPSQASRDMFLDQSGNVDSARSLVSTLAVGVPGTVAGLIYGLKKYGSLPLADVISPAHQLANDGIVVNDNLSKSLANYGRETMLNHETSRKIFFKPDGSNWQKGDVLVQKNLANSLELITKSGADAFYRGDIANEIVKEMQKQGGLITHADLANYKVIEREPVKGNYRGYDIYSMPAPSSGGIHIIQMLNILENFNLKKLGQNSADSIHLMAEAMKYAFADRSEYLGDPDFVKVPTSALISKDYAKSIAKKIKSQKAVPSQKIKPGKLTPYESDQTTHYSVVDRFGNAVSVTYTLNTNFGTGIVAGETGILLNNEMDDFSAKPGVPNYFGLIGGEANAIAAGKRPLSSMSPTIITKNGQTVLVTGSPGGSRIITTVLQMILNVLDFEMNVAEASSAPRIHHQWYPEAIRIEKGISTDTIKLLEKKGHKVVVKPTMGSTQSILVAPSGFYGSGDPRTENDLAAGF